MKAIKAKVCNPVEPEPLSGGTPSPANDPTHRTLTDLIYLAHASGMFCSGDSIVENRPAPGVARPWESRFEY